MSEPEDKLHRGELERVEHPDVETESAAAGAPVESEPNSRIAARAAAARAERGSRPAEPEQTESARAPLPPLPAPAPRPGIFAGSWADEPD